jgi:hypothetical protein
VIDSAISIATVELEIEDSKEYSEHYGWVISTIDKDNLVFSVLLQSPIDQEKYLLDFGFDDYPEKPFKIDFIHPITRERGMAKCLPKSNDSFFHPSAFVICHPCSRKAYKDLSGPHGDWSMSGWRSIAGEMKTLKHILHAIYTRLSNKEIYLGRMAQ